MGKIEHIERKKLFMEVSERLEEIILSGEFKAGDKLPTEEMLTKKYGVSRNVIREGLKNLMERGLVEIIQGKGTFVSLPDPGLITKTMSRFIQGVNKQSNKNLYDDLFETRYILEIANAKLAVKMATEEDLIEMENTIVLMREKAESHQEWAKADLMFHINLARSTKNMFLPVLLEPITSYLIEAIVLGHYAKDATKRALRDHTEIIKKIRERDEKGVEKAMLDHLHQSEIQVKQAVLSM
jgi:GntR family transcriptional repressor for pyruvate dehydrogenase complex